MLRLVVIVAMDLLRDDDKLKSFSPNGYAA
jgi:hypothetical protein